MKIYIVINEFQNRKSPYYSTLEYNILNSYFSEEEAIEAIKVLIEEDLKLMPMGTAGIKNGYRIYESELKHEVIPVISPRLSNNNKKG